MTHTISPALDLRGLDDDQLPAMWRAADDVAQAALRLECERRDRKERLANARKAIYDEWYLQARAQYEAADRDCNGELVNDAPGWPQAQADQPGRDDFALWTLPEREAMRFATWELKDWWKANGGRMSYDAYRRQRAADMREQRQAASERTEDNDDSDYGEAWGHEQQQPERAVVDGDAASGHRRERAADTVRPGRGGQQHGGAAGGPVRYARPIQPGRPVMTVATEVSGTVRGACRHPGRTSGLCGDCPRRLAGTSPAPRPMLPARRDSTPPARQVQLDGARLADLADAWTGKHCYLTDAARHSSILWAMAQHFRAPDESRTMVWEKFPHLLYIATRPGSGKTTAMTVTGFLCAPFFFGIDSNPTAPGLCFTIAQEHAVVCIDEAHRLIGPKGTRKADVVTIMCKSFERRGNYLNGRGGKVNRVPVYSPMMIAAKEDPFLTSAGEEIADVIERSHLIYMSKPPAGTELAPVTAATETQGRLIAEKMAQWAAQQMADTERFSEAVRQARAAAAEIGFANRDADVWLAQFTVAALCSPGHLQAACDAALELRRNQPAPRDEDDADPLADLEASLTDGAGLSSWGMADSAASLGMGAGFEAEPEPAQYEPEWTPTAPEDEWDWQDEPPAPEPVSAAVEDAPEHVHRPGPAAECCAPVGGDTDAPLTPVPPVSDPAAFNAFAIRAGGKPERLVGAAAEDMAKLVCQAKAGQALDWNADGRGGWYAVAGGLTFALAPIPAAALAV